MNKDQSTRLQRALDIVSDAYYDLNNVGTELGALALHAEEIEAALGRAEDVLGMLCTELCEG